MCALVGISEYIYEENACNMYRKVNIKIVIVNILKISFLYWPTVYKFYSKVLAGWLNCESTVPSFKCLDLIYECIKEYKNKHLYNRWMNHPGFKS